MIYGSVQPDSICLNFLQFEIAPKIEQQTFTSCWTFLSGAVEGNIG
jgi:hypothetical protein